ncbi:PAS domain-containing protein [Streptacidiphilus fuscans]|uniref:histidine kinase n=1 Tax=Streptacidiphilus fuscans TaxID=2789292 RepID=A0A931B7C3_9ACTN|nr:PAS domain-containing protein [Streptacidiphilus fuscans]MBF9070807.1 PAS domain-containing protein [Streptacidiphilus fuscans]
MSSRPTRGTARLAAILDALPDALLLVNSNGTVVDANDAAVQSMQAPGTSLVGRGVLDLLPDFDPSRIPGSMRPRGKSRDGSDVDDDAPVRMTARRTDGSAFPVEVQAAEFEDDGRTYASGGGTGGGLGSSSLGGGGGYYGATVTIASPSERELLLIVVRDLQPRLEVEAELRRQHKQTEMILRAAAEGVVGVDTDGRVVLVNPAAAHILGHRAGELGGQELLPLVMHSRADGSPLPPEESPLSDTLNSGRRHRVREATLWRKDGKPVTVELSTAPVRDGEQFVGAVMTFTDRTAYLALEARHEHLTAVMEQELRSPLDRLNETLEQLARDPAGQLWPEANWVLRRLADECRRTSQMLDGVLEYQRFDAALDAGREQLQREPVALEKVLTEAISEATTLLGEGRVEFSVHPSPVEVEVDEKRLASAIAHLIADVALPPDSASAGGEDGNGGSGHRGSAGRNGGGRGAGGRGSNGRGGDLFGMAVGMASGLSGRRHRGNGPETAVVIAAAQRGEVARIEIRGPGIGGAAAHLPIARGVVEHHGGVLQSYELPGREGLTYVVELPLDPDNVAVTRPLPAPGENATAILPDLPPELAAIGEGHASHEGQQGREAREHGTGEGAEGREGRTGRAAARAGKSADAAQAAQAARAANAGGRAESAGTTASDAASDGAGLPALPPGPSSHDNGPASERADLADGAAGGPAEVPTTATPSQGTDRSRRRNRLPAPEVVRPPRSAAQAQAEAEAEAELAAAAAAEARGEARAQGSGDGSGSGSGSGDFPGLIGGPVYPGLEHALPPAGSMVQPEPRRPANNGNGRRRRLALGPATGDATPASASPALEPVQQMGLPDMSPDSDLPHAADPALPEPFGGRFGQQPQQQQQPEHQGNGVNSMNGQNGANGQGQGASQHPNQAPAQRRRAHAAQQAQPQGQGQTQADAQMSGGQQRGPLALGPGVPSQARQRGNGTHGGVPIPLPPGGGGTLGGNTGVMSLSQSPLQSVQTPPRGTQLTNSQSQADPYGGPPQSHLPQQQGPQGNQQQPQGNEGQSPENGPEFIAGADYPTMVTPASDGHPRRLLVWPEPDPSTRQALQDRGYRPVIVRSREEVDAQVTGYPAALFVDPLTGPITRTALQSLRTAAGDANVPVLVTAGLGQATPEAAYGADPAILLRALAPRDSERHAPRVLLVEQDPHITAAFTATLERRGMHVEHAASESDAVSRAASVQPNLVVMDLMLIRRRRMGIVDWLRSNNRLQRTPLVVYTSVDGAEQRAGLRSGETVLFLAERSTSPEVQARIVDLLGRIGSLGEA